jgi:hypothetical protein
MFDQEPKVEENNNFYVYVFIRKDIPLEHQVTQACHAALEIGYDHNRPETPTYLITISVANELALRKIETKLSRLDIKTHMFWEPDPLPHMFWEPDPLPSDHETPMGHTALATEPLSGAIRQEFSDFQLWTAFPHEFVGAVSHRVNNR